jgi:hypothetical protein
MHLNFIHILISKFYPLGCSLELDRGMENRLFFASMVHLLVAEAQDQFPLDIGAYSIYFVWVVRRLCGLKAVVDSFLYETMIDLML